MNDTIVYNSEKFKVLLHYLIYQCQLNQNMSRTVLNKLLYFSDFNYYELYEKSLTGETYIKKPRGPVSTHFIQAKNELIDEGKIEEKTQKVINYFKYTYNSISKPSLNLLSDDELNVVNDVINKISHMYSGQISEYSHGDLPWMLAEDDEELNYEAVFYRDPEYSVRDYDDDL